MTMLVPSALATALMLAPTIASSDPLTCNLTGYKATPGLTATAIDNSLTVTWDGERNQEVRLRFAIDGGTPTIRELAIRRKDSPWATLASNVTADYRVVAGVRRMSNQQISPLRGLGVELTSAIVDTYRWDPFWDAPLDLSAPSGRGGNPPPAEGVANQPGLPRRSEEITRASVVYRATSCDVTTNGARLEIAFPGAQLGVFAGTLQYSVFKGSNLIQQEILATTNEPWVAYKYDAGLKGLSTTGGARVAWRDTANNWQDYRFGGARNDDPVPLKTSGRLVIAERGGAGSIAAFPPPHNFFWAREVAINLSTGYPDSVKDLPFFNDPHYQGVGFRWGMGLDRSEQRLCEYRCQPLFDDMNNWIADKPIPPKYILSISEVRHQQPGDEIYASSPVTYVKVDPLPKPDDTSPVIQALMHGDSFVTSGEVLIASYSVKGTGAQRTIVADVEWTFPLNFVEVVWGDGTRSDRRVISTTDLPVMGSHHFEIPFSAAGRRWVRFAAWDSAGNGAMSQPIKLSNPTSTTGAR
jgi:hypothetical protein